LSAPLQYGGDNVRMVDTGIHWNGRGSGVPEAGPASNCSPRHPTHFEPPSLS